MVDLGLAPTLPKGLLEAKKILGTKIFMAISALRGERYSPIHDLESHVWLKAGLREYEPGRDSSIWTTRSEIIPHCVATPKNRQFSNISCFKPDLLYKIFRKLNEIQCMILCSIHRFYNVCMDRLNDFLVGGEAVVGLAT